MRKRGQGGSGLSKTKTTTATYGKQRVRGGSVSVILRGRADGREPMMQIYPTAVQLMQEYLDDLYNPIHHHMIHHHMIHHHMIH